MPSLYQQLAHDIEQGIASGTYVAGERLPGVRALARTRGVSVATAVAAYEALSDRGHVEARPRSGYYVRARQALRPIESRPAAKTAAPRLVTGQAMAMAMLKAASDPAIVQLGAAMPDPAFLPTQAIGRVMARVMQVQRSQAAGYMLPAGAPELRRQIAQRMSQGGSVVSADDLVITTGCQEALSLALRAVTQPGDVVAVESPVFYGLLHVLESLGLEALEIPVHHREGLSLDALAFALDRWPVKACVLAPNFGNPLGCGMSDEAKLALVRLLGKHKVPLIEDDIYGDLGFDGRRPATCKSLAPRADILLCSSYSKSLSPGLRAAPGSCRSPVGGHRSRGRRRCRPR